MAYTLDNSRNQNTGLLILRAGVGVLFLIFGWMKLAAGEQMWTGVGGSMQFLGISAWPVFWGLLASIAEFAGGLLLILGLFTRFAAVFLALTMIVAVILKINVSGALAEISSPLVMLLVNICFAFAGGGVYSLDHALHQRKNVPVA